MRRLLLAVLVIVALCSGGLMARADDLTPQKLVLMKLFGPDPITPEMFTPGFLAQVSIEQILAVFSQTRHTVGAPVSIEGSAGAYIVHTASYNVPVDIALDPAGKVGGLLIHPAVPVFANVDAVLAAVKALPGQTAWLVLKNGAPIEASNEAVPLAVGSAFKLGVLAALGDEITAGHVAWDQVVRLSASDISLPSGQLQLLPIGSPLTVHTLAAFMVSQSDNTAADTLLDLVGRDKVQARLGLDFVLKTGEFFKLKADPALRLRFTGADAAGKLKAAGEMAAMPLPSAVDVGAALNDGAEWYLPLTKLCSLIEATKDLDVFTINPGVARPEDWKHIAFKGGSEVGVANLTSAMTDAAGNNYCIAMTWNDHKALDETRFTALYGALITKVAGK